jgi:Cu/Ag efflux pump CusA
MESFFAATAVALTLVHAPLLAFTRVEEKTFEPMRSEDVSHTATACSDSARQGRQ